jgi:hypothetical protein
MTTLLLASLFFLTTPLKPSYTKEEIRSEYEKVVKLERTPYKGVDYFMVKIDTLATSIVTPFFRENAHLVEYLQMQHYQVVYEYHKRMKLAGNYKDIVQDSAQLAMIMFERYLPMISNDLNAKGSKIDNYEPWKKPEITLDRLAGNAAKFFYPDSVHPDGRIQSHICIGFNGFKDLTDVRSVMMEAFCWSVIQPQVMAQESTPMMEDFSKATKLAGELQLSGEPETKLKRYQGVVWGQMSQSKVLRDLLLQEYEKKKHLLTFTLKQE